MKLSLILILLSIMQAFPYEGYAQQKVTFNLKDVTIKQVLNEIKSQTDFKFLYRNDDINIKNKISFEAENETTQDVLNRLFQNTLIEYKIIEKQIVLTKKMLSFKVQKKEIRGIITGSDGEPLPGASIVLKGTSIGTTTDFDGKFSLAVEGDSPILVISYVGFQKKEIIVGTATNYNITLNENAQSLDGVTLLGSRGKPRSNLDSAVPVDVIGVAELSNTGQPDIGQQLQYSAPSFNAVKFGINDLAPLIDPASLRGLATDQTLLLVNGKRRHKVSFFSLNHGVGKGQLGNDINSIPSAAVKRVEILRDGAAAQYGSDAIAGVMNLQLNDARSGGSFKFYTGSGLSNPKYDDIGSNANLDGESIYGTVKDGETAQLSLNFGLPWGEKGFINTTINFQNSEPYDRSGEYTHSEGWYPDDQNLSDAENQAIDEEQRLLNGIDLDRTVLGSVKNTNGSLYINAGNEIDENWDFYTFGGLLRKRIVGSIFSRAPARDERAVLEIYPNGYNPVTPSVLTDWQILTGVKGKLNNDWSLDLSAGYSGNDLQLFIENAVNPSLGINSPTEFFTGGLQVTQTVFNADFVKNYDKVSLLFGSELRYESYKQTQGEAASWQIGSVVGNDIGSSGREGFSDVTEGRFTRNNIGFYTEVEADITDNFLTTAAIRFENYSDFGSDFSYKIAGRYKLGDKASLRASVNRSFRAPALAQVEYSNFAQTTFDDDGNTIVTPFLPVTNPLAQRAFGDISLKPETSLDFAVGLTFKPSEKFSFTFDGYRISIDDRIVISSGIDASLFTEFDGAGYDEVNIFTNALNTSTTGFDFVGTYSEYLGEDKLDFSLGLNLNKTKVESINESDVFTSQGISIVDDRDVTFLTKGTPSRKIILSGTYTTGKFGFTARGSNFGEVTDARETIDDNGTFQVFSPKTIMDLSVVYNMSNKFSITAGANNIFDTYPDMLFSPNVRGEVIYSRRTNQFGTQGRFLNLALNYNW
ncbi:TonB-dependent receptor [Maribacter sp.]|uniref:TonB-dependent receptor n=1 Tax=Maribacter sp. TaxID=1897614 RepID=UPI0025C6089A|nr:TonB-dependent receptor [Maribacter sp.]